jgi:hypothetical protein
LEFLAKLKKRVQKKSKSSPKKKHHYNSSSDLDSEYKIGLSGMEDLVSVERVEINKSKKTKLGSYTPSNPIKTLAVMMVEHQSHHSSKKSTLKKLVRVMGIYCSMKREQPNNFPT